MGESYTLAAALAAAARVVWRLGLLIAVVWWASRRSPYRSLLIHRGHGLAAVLFLIATTVALRWVGGLNESEAWSAAPVLAGLVAGNVAFVVWGALVVARAEVGSARRVALSFFLLSLVPGGLLLTLLL